MSKAPNIWTLENLFQHIKDGPQSQDAGGDWVPSRPLGFYSLGRRIKAAWLVFCGKADAVTWPDGQ